MLGEGELGLSALGLGFAGFSGRTEECFTTELHLELSVYTARGSLFSTHRPRTYPASFCPLLIPRVHLHTHLRSFTVCRAFTLGPVHYSGYDNYVTKIWCICCLTTCLGVGCFVFSYLGKSFGKTISQKTTKQGKTFGVCQLLRADSKGETEKQEYFNHFCSCIGLKRNIH